MSSAAPWRAVSPVAGFGELGDGPGVVVDEASAAADLDVEAGRRHAVERDHVVVGVFAEPGGDRGAGLGVAVEGVADVVEGVHLEHEVVERRLVGGDECEAVVAGVAVQEDDVVSKRPCFTPCDPPTRGGTESFRQR